jgi:hypothetical protein
LRGLAILSTLGATNQLLALNIYLKPYHNIYEASVWRHFGGTWFKSESEIIGRGAQVARSH